MFPYSQNNIFGKKEDQPNTTPSGPNAFNNPSQNSTVQPFGNSTAPPFGGTIPSSGQFSGTNSIFGSNSQSQPGISPFGNTQVPGSITSPFGSSNATTFNNPSSTTPFNTTSNTTPFNTTSNTTPFNATSNTTPFNATTSATPFNATPFNATGSATPFNVTCSATSFATNTATNTSPFNNPSNAATPFGSGSTAANSLFNAPPTSGPSPIVTNQSEASGKSFSNTSVPFGSSSTQVGTSLFGNLNSQIKKPDDSGMFQSKANESSKDVDLANQSSLLSAVKDNSLNLYNLTLQEIIDRHSALLDANITEFERDAKSVFERDLKLIRSKNNYLAVQKKISEENAKLDELSQVLDFFSQRLDEIENSECSDGARVVGDFEEICTKFYEKIEAFKDDQDEVLDLVNENYEIIETIDNKLDMIDRIREMNK